MLLIILKNAANCKVVNGESGVTNLRDSRKGRRGRRPRTRGSALLLKFLQCLAGFGKIWVGGQSLPELLGGVALFSLLQQNNSKPVMRRGRVRIGIDGGSQVAQGFVPGAVAAGQNSQVQGRAEVGG